MSWPLGDSDEEYTKCHECGLWDYNHTSACATGLREAYVEGRIELEEFEARLLLGDGF